MNGLRESVLNFESGLENAVSPQEVIELMMVSALLWAGAALLLVLSSNLSGMLWTYLAVYSMLTAFLLVQITQCELSVLGRP